MELVQFQQSGSNLSKNSVTHEYLFRNQSEKLIEGLDKDS